MGKNKTTISDVPLLPEIFRWEDPKILVPFTFHRISRKMFVNGKQPTPLFSRTSRLLAESATFRVP